VQLCVDVSELNDRSGAGVEIPTRNPTPAAVTQMLRVDGAGPPETASRQCEVRLCHWTMVLVLNVLREICYALVLLTHLCSACIYRKRAAHGDFLHTPKRVVFIRHGQGRHNISCAGYAEVDPPLTAAGEGQVGQMRVGSERDASRRGRG
jgi:hypothetical protein